MATRHEQEGGSRLWRGMRALIFGEGEPTLREEIEDAIDEAEDSRPVAGDLSPTERQMLRNLLHFGERTAGEIAVTRGDMMAVPSRIDFDALVRAFADAGHSRLPVYGESLDQVGALRGSHQRPVADDPRSATRAGITVSIRLKCRSRLRHRCGARSR